MADERSRAEASQALTEQLGPAAAAALMECIPPFGWHEIATKGDMVLLKEDLRGLQEDLRRLPEDLRRLEQRLEERMELRIRALESKYDGRFDRLDGRLEGLEGRLSALIELKASAQNRALLLAVGAAVVVSLLANLLR